MTLKVSKADVWVATIEDRSGGAADRIEPLTRAGANFEFVFARRTPEQPGRGMCMVSPVKGKKVEAAAAAAGFVRAPDITSSKASLVNNYREADWVRAIRHGVGPDRRALLFMPSEEYNRLADDDFAALVAYVRSLPPGRGVLTEIRMPLLMRARYGVGLIKDAPEQIDHRLPPPPAQK